MYVFLLKSSGSTAIFFNIHTLIKTFQLDPDNKNIFHKHTFFKKKSSFSQLDSDDYIF